MQNHLMKQYINGAWEDGSSEKTITNINPFTEEELFTMRSASADDVDRAYRSAQAAQKSWEACPPAERRAVLDKAADLLDKRHDELVDWLMKEVGSTAVKANVELTVAKGIVREAASFPYRMKGQLMDSDIPGKENRIYRSAKGVIGVIGPWNFPFHLSMRSVAPAIATGNSVVLKPASEAIVTAGTLLADVFEQAGLPQGVLNVVSGRGSEIGDAVVTHPIPKLISFTGSTEVGRHIAAKAGEGLKETSLELGGNNVLIVAEDADLEAAVESAAFGKFLHQGQICMSLNRIFVHTNVHDEFVRKFEEKIKTLKSGDPTDSDVTVGPLINSEQLERIKASISASVEQGAEVIAGGKNSGNVLEPTLMTGVTNEMPIAAEEIFGPVAPILRFETEEEAMALTDALPYGLSGAVHTADIERGTAIARQIESGMFHVNDQSVNDEPHIAFGGEKDSGLGRFGGEWVLAKFTREQWVSVQREQRGYPF